MFQACAIKNDGTALNVQGKTMAEVAQKLCGFQADRIDLHMSFTADDRDASVNGVIRSLPGVVECLAHSDGCKPT